MNQTFRGKHFPQTITREGFTITARIERDDHADAPWDAEDGHGPVSAWLDKRCKRPGQMILHEDRGRARFYDFEEAVKIAKRDGWDAPPFGEGTAGERADRAVRADFERLRRWCADEWCYVAVVLAVSRNGVTLDEWAASLWGIESDAGEYLSEVANDLIEESLQVAHAAVSDFVSRLTTINTEN